MTGQRSQLINFVSKFLGSVRFGNDQIAKIMGYGDYQLGNVTISQNLGGADLLSRSRDTNLYTISMDDMLKSSPICLSKLKFEKDHLCSACSLRKSKKFSHKPKDDDTNQEKLYLVHMDLCGPMHVESINGKNISWLSSMTTQDLSPLFLWAEAVNKACYTQKRSLICLRYNKTPYELMYDKKPDLSYLHVFGSLSYPTNDIKDLGKLKAKTDIGIFIGYTPAKKAF
ncbi:retrovirus-related pol polyprotein from transposon TNT 1-94 [Tanacetum coccineum]